MNSGHSSKKKSGFVFYVTSYSFPHKINSQSCVINFFLLWLLSGLLINGGTPEVLCMLKGRYVSKRIAEGKIYP